MILLALVFSLLFYGAVYIVYLVLREILEDDFHPEPSRLTDVNDSGG